MTSAVRIRGLSRRFGRRLALDHVDLDVATGEIFGLIGPNGAGKTTLIRTLCSLLGPTEGEIEIFGLDLAGNADRIRPAIGYMSQALSLYPTLTIEENLRFHRDLYGPSGRGPNAGDADVTRLVGLDANDLSTPVAHLSTGTRQRAALAVAVLHRPRLLFLDEPTSGVDPVGRRDIWRLLRDLSSTGTTIVVSTHVMAEAERCDRVALMANGRVLTCGRPSDLREGTETVVAVVVADPWRAAYNDLRSHFADVTLRGTSIHVRLSTTVDVDDVINRTVAHAIIRRIDRAMPTFEDAFVTVVRRARVSKSAPV